MQKPAMRNRRGKKASRPAPNSTPNVRIPWRRETQWKVLHVVAEPRGKRTVLIIVVHRRQVAPGLVGGPATSRRPILEIDAKPFPAEKEQAEARWTVFGSEARPKSGRREKQRDETGFEKHAVRLIARAKSCAAAMNERKQTKQTARVTRGQRFIAMRIEATRPRTPDQHQSVIGRAQPQQ